MSDLQAIAERIWGGVASAQDLASIKPEDVRSIKSDTEHARRRFYAEKAHQTDEGAAIVRGVVISTEDQDRMGDRILLAGWSLDDFKKNPVVLFGHNDSALPVAKGLKVRRGNSASGKRSLLGDEQFFDDDMLEEKGVLVKRHVMAGSLPGRSVGFLPHDIHVPEDEEETKSLDLGPAGVLFKAQDLLEWSVVPVPANAHALQERAMKAFRAVQNDANDLHADVLRWFEESFPLTEEEFLKREREARRSRVAMPGDLANDLRALVGAATSATPVEDDVLFDAHSEQPTAAPDMNAPQYTSVTTGTSSGTVTLGFAPQYIVDPEIAKRLESIEKSLASITDHLSALKRAGGAEVSTDDAATPNAGTSRGKNPRNLYEALVEQVDQRLKSRKDGADNGN